MKPILLAGAMALVVAALFTALTYPVAAGLFAWSPLGRLLGQTGPEPYVSVIVPHPDDPSVVYAGSLITSDNSRLVYRSEDGGDTWTAAAGDLPTDLPNFAGINDLLLWPHPPGDPRHADDLFAGLDGGGVWFSHDSGASWRPADDGSIDGDDTVLALMGNGDVVYALTTAGVHRSRDGAAWEMLADGLPAPGAAFYYDLAANPNDPLILYAATNPLGLFRSADGGDTWHAANGDLPEGTRYVHSVSVSPLTGEVFINLRGVGLFRSGDGGAHWTPAQAGITYQTALYGTVYAPVFCPDDPAIAFTFNSDGIFRSDDGGDTWTPFAEGLTGAETISALAFHTARPYTVYAGTAISGVWNLTMPRGGRYFVPVVMR